MVDNGAIKTIGDVETVVLSALELMEDKVMRSQRALEKKLEKLERECARRHEELKQLLTGKRANDATATKSAKRTSRDDDAVATIISMDLSRPTPATAEKQATREGVREMNARAPQKKLKASPLATASMNASLQKSVKKKPSAASPEKSKRSKNSADLCAHITDLTADERLLVETGKGRRGEPMPTPLGWAYWTATGHETLRTIGNKIGLEPLTLYSMNRWHHKLKNYDIDQEFTANSKLSLPVPPFEDWETEYIAADRTKIFTRLLDRIDEVWPEVLRNAEPLRSLKREQLKTYPDSGTLYRQLRETLDNAEAAAKKFNDGDETLRDVQQCRKQLVTRWHRDGFLLPDEIAFKADDQ